MSELKELSAKLEHFEAGTPASAEAIQSAERALGLSFAEDYRSCLSRYGCISWFGHILTGISPYPGIDIVRVTTEQREYNPQVPSTFYVLEDPHIDGVIIWQDASGAVYETRPHQPPVRICSSLLEYITQT